MTLRTYFFVRHSIRHTLSVAHNAGLRPCVTCVAGRAALVRHRLGSIADVPDDHRAFYARKGQRAAQPVGGKPRPRHTSIRSKQQRMGDAESMCSARYLYALHAAQDAAAAAHETLASATNIAFVLMLMQYLMTRRLHSPMTTSSWQWIGTTSMHWSAVLRSSTG